MRKSLADRIEQYIKALIDRSENRTIEIQRAELAETFACVPSQITYVIATRFSEKSGYFTESKRGGKGYVRIMQCSSESSENPNQVTPLFDFIEELYKEDKITAREKHLIKVLFIANSQNFQYGTRKIMEKVTYNVLQEFFK
jgi:transcriptional regulator CtsR